MSDQAMGAYKAAVKADHPDTGMVFGVSQKTHHRYRDGFLDGYTAAAAAPPPWQPIATAPYNVPILVTDGFMVVVVERGKLAGEDWPEAVGFGGYEWEWDFTWGNLTHWMPCPVTTRQASL